MEKKKKITKMITRFISLVLIFGILLYGLNGVMVTISTEGNLTDNMLDYNKVYEFMLYGEDMQNRWVALVLAIVGTIFMASKMRGKNKGYINASEFGLHGSAKFAVFNDFIKSGAASKKNEISLKDPFKSLEIEEGIIIGKVKGEKKLLILHEKTTLNNNNVLIVGSPGSSKGQAFVFNNLLNIKSRSMIISDPKGEIYAGTHQIKEDQGYKVIRIDFQDMLEGSYNPLDNVFNSNDALKVATDIMKNSGEDNKEDFFFQAAKDLFVGLILYCKSAYESPNIPVHIKREFNKLSEDDTYLTRICNSIGENHDAYQYLKEASALEDRTRSSVLSSFATQTAIFNNAEIKKMTQMSSFKFSDIANEKVIIYVKLSMRESPLRPLTSTFFTQMIDVLYKEADRNHGKIRTKPMFILDEFANIGAIKDYNGTLSTCRSLGMSFVTIVQDLSQIEAIYEKLPMKSIVNNHDTHLYLKTKDPDTAKFFSRAAGDATAEYKGNSLSTGTGWLSTKNPSNTTSDQYNKRALITEGELINIPNEECYAFITNHDPIHLEKAFQYKVFPNFLTKGEGNWVYEDNRKKYMKLLKKQGIINELSTVEKTSVEKDSTNNENPLEIESDLLDNSSQEEQIVSNENDNMQESLEQPNIEEKNKSYKGETYETLANSFLMSIQEYRPNTQETVYSVGKSSNEETNRPHTLGTEVEVFISSENNNEQQSKLDELVKSGNALIAGLEDANTDDLLNGDTLDEFLSNLNGSSTS